MYLHDYQEDIHSHQEDYVAFVLKIWFDHTLSIWLGIQFGQRYGYIADRKKEKIVNSFSLA